MKYINTGGYKVFVNAGGFKVFINAGGYKVFIIRATFGKTCTRKENIVSVRCI